MAKVGSIMTYHDGTSYEVGDIFDQKISKFYDTKTEVLVHFTDEGMVDECGNEWQYIHDNTTDTMANVPVQDCMFNGAILSNSETFANEGCKMSNFTSGNIVLEKEMTFGGSEPFMIECWVRCNDIPAVKNTYVGKSIWSFYDDNGKGFAISNHLNCPAGGFSTGTACMTVNTFFGGSSQTLTYNFADTKVSKNTGMRNLRYYNIYYKPSLNDIYCYVFFNTGSTITPSKVADATWRKQVINYVPEISLKKITIYGNNGFGHHSDIAEFRITKGYNKPFTVPSGVWGRMDCPTVPQHLFYPTNGLPAAGNIPIRHNNQTYYAPLISNTNFKTSPCIAVRHNNQTYYTVK